MPIVTDRDLIFPQGTPVVVKSTSPTAGDSEYAVGTVWVDDSTNLIYMLADASPGAAVWRDISAGGVGGTPTGPAGGDLAGNYPNPVVVQVGARTKSFTYNGDGTLATVTDAYGTKTFNYTGGQLTSIVGTGEYPTKTFGYTGDNLTSVTVS